MKKILEKIKLSKESLRDIMYVAAVIIIAAAIMGFFIWSVKIVISAVNAAFFGANQDISSEILSFDLVKFSKIAPRLNIRFSPEESIGIQNPSEIAQPLVVEKPASIIEQPKENIINISKISLKILNGTATPGLAGFWKNKFIETGFAKENISAGNANKRDYSGITIINNSAEGIIKKIIEVFSQSNLQVKLEKDNNLNENDFIIIIGK